MSLFIPAYKVCLCHVTFFISAYKVCLCHVTLFIPAYKVCLCHVSLFISAYTECGDGTLDQQIGAQGGLLGAAGGQSVPTGVCTVLSEIHMIKAISVLKCLSRLGVPLTTAICAEKREIDCCESELGALYSD